MKQRIYGRLALLCFGLLLSSPADAHPHDSPLTFIPHINDNGAVIYTNIPKSCFVNGVLLCTRYHPLFAKGRSTAKPGGLAEDE